MGSDDDKELEFKGDTQDYLGNAYKFEIGKSKIENRPTETFKVRVRMGVAIIYPGGRKPAEKERRKQKQK